MTLKLHNYATTQPMDASAILNSMARKHQAGLSLIELMIAITLGLLVMAAVTTLFVATSRTNSEMAKANAQIENGRFAIQILQNDIIHGGFWGGFVPEFDDLTHQTAPGDVPAQQLPANTVPAPCVDYASWDAEDGTTDGDDTAYKAKLLGLPMQAYDAVPAGCAAVVVNKQANTDVLITRHAATCIPGTGSCAGVANNTLYFQFSQCENEITATPPPPPASPYVYIYNLMPSTNATASNFTLKKRGCTGIPPAATAGTTADIRKYISNMYYIRDYAVTAGDGIPSLVRSEFDYSGGAYKFKTPDALINGIEGFRVEFGIDNTSDNGTNIITGTDSSGTVDPTYRYTAAIKWADPDDLVSPINRGDGNVDQFVRGPAASVDQLSNVVVVKIYVLARADQPTPGYTDTKIYSLGSAPTICSTAVTSAACTTKTLNPSYKRHVFSTAVRLINVSGRRETP